MSILDRILGRSEEERKKLADPTYLKPGPRVPLCSDGELNDFAGKHPVVVEPPTLHPRREFLDVRKRTKRGLVDVLRGKI